MSLWYGLLLVCVAFKVAWVVFTLPLVVLTLPSPKVMVLVFFFSDQVGGRNSNEALCATRACWSSPHAYPNPWPHSHLTMSSWLRALDSPSAHAATHTSSRRAVCQRKRTLRIPYHNKADGFMAALVLSLNQVKFCEIHACQPRIVWGMYPKCKYTGVRFPGRTPFYDAAHGPNAFEYYFLPVCDGEPAQSKSPMLTCDQRERVHRQLPWSVRTYYYGAGDPQPEPGHNESFAYDAAWYAGHRREGARLVSSYLRLQPALLAKVDRLAEKLFGQRSAEAPVLGVHLRGTDKGKYLQTAGSGRQVAPQEYESYVRAFLAAYPRARIFVATDSPSFLQEVREKWPRGALRFVGEVLRDEANVAFGKGHKRDNFRKGEEVLLDTLLLSRCDWLLHAASGAEPAAQTALPHHEPARPPDLPPPARQRVVTLRQRPVAGVAEFAMYWNLQLHERSVHLQYTQNRQRPPWMKPELATG